MDLQKVRANSVYNSIVVRVLPQFDPSTGYLPVGEHGATWSEVVERFGWSPWRRRLLDGLAESLDLLADAGCRRVWLNGSFVTAKEEPDDFDAVWDPADVDDDALDLIFGPLGLLDGRRLQKQRFGGEWFPNIVEVGSGLTFANFFQRDRDAVSKGVVLLDLTQWRHP
jgi:hypothetical protein